MHVIGTAGHVDHGKSTLVNRLTGIDPDRLQEEKDRGLTIDLGFAWFTLPSGRDVSVVDVPGHQRFVKNMLVGAGGFDLAVLVIAADDGPRPQTHEHLAILDLLGVPSLVVALTKVDAVDEELVELATMDVHELLEATRFAGAPVVPVSAVSGDGIEALLAALDAQLEATRERTDRRRPRLAVDRAFTARGFGTVVTGTLVDGALEVGADVEFQPGGRHGRVRGLQRHGVTVDRLRPGTRAAINVSGIEAKDIERGMVLARPGTLRSVTTLGVRLRAVSTLDPPMKRISGVTFLSGTAEAEAKLRLLDPVELFPDDEAWATVRLDRPLAVMEGDRFVVRTPNATAAGGVVVTTEPRTLRLRRALLVERLAQRLEGTPRDRVLLRLADGPVSRDALPAAAGITAAEASEVVDALLASGDAVEGRGALFGTGWLDAEGDELLSVVRAVLAERPLRLGVPQEEVRSRLHLDTPAFRAVLARALTEGRIEEWGDAHVSVPGYEVQLSPSRQQEIDRFLAGLRETRYAGAGDLSDPELVHYLVEHGHVEDAAGTLIATDAFREMTNAVIEYLQEHETISLAEGRDLLETNRKVAQVYLERLDAMGVTRRMGDARRLRHRPSEQVAPGDS